MEKGSIHKFIKVNNTSSLNGILIFYNDKASHGDA